jgi:myo-inositol catabolism protein IolC
MHKQSAAVEGVVFVGLEKAQEELAEASFHLADRIE